MAGESALNRLPIAAKVGVAAGFVLLVGAAYYVLLYGDIASSIKAAKGQELQLHADLAEARKNEFAYQKDLAELHEREQRQRDLNKILPTTTEYPAFLSALQSVANSTGVVLTAWNPQEEALEPFYSRVPMRLELRGQFHQIAKFFYGVGQLDRIINMENISITDPKPDSGTVSVRVEALATAFRALDESAAAKAGGASGDARDRAMQHSGGKP
jgi:type IV pilus assembly protein PilO